MKIRGKILKDKETGMLIVSIPCLDIDSYDSTLSKACSILKERIELEKEDIGPFEIEFSDKTCFLYLIFDKPNKLAGLILKKNRTKYGLSLDAVAKKLGKSSKNQIARWEKGDNDISLNNFLSAFYAITGFEFEW